MSFFESYPNISLVIFIFFWIIPCWAINLLWLLIPGAIFKNQALWKKLLFSQILSIFISGIVAPILIFVGIYQVNIITLMAICILYTGINIKVFYSDDWKKYK